MRGTALAALDLTRLMWSHERSQLQFLLSNAIILPGAMCYFGLRVLADTPAVQMWWIAGTVTFSLGMTAIGQVGFNVLDDRFSGRLALLRSSALDRRAYHMALVVLSTIQSAILAAAALTILQLTGLAASGSAAIALALVAAFAAASGVGALAATIALRVPDFESGAAVLTVCQTLLVLVSPVFYSASRLPEALVPISWLSPFTHVAPIVRSALLGEPAPWASIAAVGVVVAALNIAVDRLVPWRD